MKKLILLSVLAGAMPLVSMAQDDDLYFTTEQTSKSNSYEYSSCNRNIDEYNRGYQSSYQTIGNDSIGNDIVSFYGEQGLYPDSTSNNDYNLTRRMSRFDGYNSYYGWDDPWYYDNFYFGWNYPYYGGRFGFGYSPWYYSWYDPWYYGGYYDPWYYSGWRGYYGGYYSHNNSIRNMPRGYVSDRAFGGRQGTFNSSRNAFGRSDLNRSSNSTFSRSNARSFGRSTTNTSRNTVNNNNTSRTFSNDNSRSFGNSSSFGGSRGGGSFGGGGSRGGGGGFGGHR